MSDVRALLKAKRQEARINHPFASYNLSGQLKCSICGTTVKHASAWEGHLGSKAHRTNVVRQREEERLEKEKSRMQIFKEGEGDKETVDQEEEGHSSKRRTLDDGLADEHPGKRRKVEKESLPTDFFSDPSHAPVLLSDDSDEDDSTIETSRPQPQPDVPKSAIDVEYELFQRELTKTTDSPDLYNRATIVVEPMAASTNIPGFPVQNPETKENDLAGPTEEVFQKREQEEKELIMDRLLEEERAQEDADARVFLLKNKVELLRKKRQEARIKKSVSKQSG